MEEKKLIDLLRIEANIKQRARIQGVMIALLDLSQRSPGGLLWQDNEAHVHRCVGAAFSLWRAAFLVDAERKAGDAAIDANDALKTLLASNAFTFTDERKMNDWMVGYYLNNANYRMLRTIGKLTNYKGTAASDDAFHNCTDALERWNIQCDALEGVVRHVAELMQIHDLKGLDLGLA